MPYAGDTAFFSGRSGYSVGVQSHPVPLSDYLGIPTFASEHRYDHEYLTPRPSTIGYNKDGDFYAYGSLLGSPAFLTRQEEPKAPLREKGVHHTSYDGHLASGNLVSKYGFYTYGSVVDQYGLPFTCNHLIGSQPSKAVATDFNSEGFLVFGEDPPGAFLGEPWNRDLREQVETTVAYLRSGPRYMRYGYYECTYHNLLDASIWKDGLWHVRLQYDYQMDYAPWIWPGLYTVRYLVQIDVRISLVERHGGGNPFVSNSLETSIFQIDNNSTVTPSFATGGTAEPSPTYSVVKIGQPQLSTDIYQLDGEHFRSDFLSLLGSHPGGQLHVALSRYVSENLSDIRPSSFLAASNALDSYTMVLKTNWLQQFQHVAGILELLPDLESMSKLAAKASNGDPSALIDLIDILTEEILKTRFQRVPLIGSLKELSETEILSRLTSLLQPKTVTIYGKFNYAFPAWENSFGPGQLRLETRSKIRVHLDMSTLLAGVLVGNSVGVLPTFSRIWSLLPFSFVVDWFTNMGQRLKKVDNQLLYMCLGIRWCLYSYRVTYVPADSELDEFNLSNWGSSEPFSVSVYQREFSRWMPKLSESKYDLLSPTHSPDPLVIGSLLWQVLS
jgi:hypothetical protein